MTRIFGKYHGYNDVQIRIGGNLKDLNGRIARYCGVAYIFMSEFIPFTFTPMMTRTLLQRICLFLSILRFFVLVVVRHDLGINDMLTNFAGYTCERYRSIVGGVMVVSFLEDSNHISRQSVIRDTARVRTALF